MRKIIMSCIVMLIIYSASAQVIFGPRVGLNYSKLSLKDNRTAFDEGEARLGYQMGVFLRVKAPINGLYIQPELLFSQSNTSTEFSPFTFRNSFRRIDVPIMIGTRIGPLRINAGPSFRFLMSAETNFPNGSTIDEKSQYENTTVGYQIGVGVDNSELVFDLKYESSFSDIGGAAANQSINQLIFAIGIKLFQ